MNRRSKIIVWGGTIFIVTVGIFEIFFWFGTPPRSNHPEYSHIMVNDQALAYHVSGNGPVLLLLHSGAWSSIEYTVLQKQLNDSYTVYAVDLPGFGYSDKPQVTYSLEYLTQQMSGFIEQLPQDQVNIVGASIGGTVAVHLAAAYPEKISTVTLIDPFGFGSEINQAAIIAQVPVLAETVFTPNPVTFDFVLNHGLLSPDTMDEEYRAALFGLSQLPKAERAKLSLLRSTITMRGVHPNVVQSVKNAATILTQPVLVLWGENDTYAPTQQHATAQEYMPQAEYYILPDAGHFAHMEVPHEISQHIRTFLKTHSQP